MKIVIVGGGFGGVRAALELIKDERNHVTLISEKADLQYYPALYSAATGGSYKKSWLSLVDIFAGKPVQLVHDTIARIDPEHKKLSGEKGTYAYDQVILALGTVTTYFGIAGLDKFAYGIKSLDEIEALHEHLQEAMGVEHTVEKHYVVVGAGPTGVELAAALGYYLRRMERRFKLKNKQVTIDIVEAAPRVLPHASEAGSARVQKRLRKLGVHVHLKTAVERAEDEGITTGDKVMPSHTVVWTSGVANHPFFKANEEVFTFAPNGRVIVDAHLQASEFVYVIGDNAATQFTGLAQTALDNALFVARDIHARLNDIARSDYRPKPPASVVPVGRHWAIFEWRGLLITGWIGALIREAADLIGYHDLLPLGRAISVWLQRDKH